MPVKQVKLNLKPEIYKPLADEAKRLRMPIASLVRVILADAILPDQSEGESSIGDEVIDFSTGTDKSQSRSQNEPQKWLESETEDIVYTVEEPVGDVNNELLMNVANSLVESTNALSDATHILSESVKQLTHLNTNLNTAAQTVVQPAAPDIARQQYRQPRVDKDGELVLKLSDLLAEQGATENLSQNLTTNLSHDVIVEDLSAPAQSAEPTQPRQAEQTAQKLRKITINL